MNVSNDGQGLPGCMAQSSAGESCAVHDACYYERLMDCVSDAIISTGPDFTIRSWNRAAEKVYGWTASEAIGRKIDELLGTSFPAGDNAKIKRSMPENCRIDIEQVHTAKDGRKVNVLSQVSLLKDRSGQVAEAVAVIHDMTDRKRMEVKLQKQADELLSSRAVIEADMLAMNRLHGISTRFVYEENLTPLLDEIMDAAMEITHAEMCAIQYADRQAGSLRVIAHKGLSDELREGIDRVHNQPQVYSQIMQLDYHMVLDNAADHPNVMLGMGQRSPMLAGIQAIQGTSLMSRSGGKLGILSTVFTSPHKTTDRELHTLDMLARLTADIMERFQAEEELRRSSLATELLYEVVEKLLENGNTQGIIQELCTKVMEYLDCDIFFNYLFAPDQKNIMYLNACGGISPEEQAGLSWLERDKAICGYVADTGCRIVFEDVQHSVDEKVTCVKAMGVRAYACHPLQVMDQTLGTLSFGTRTRDAFAAGELALMKAVCGHVAVAINRARTEDNLKSLSEALYEKNKLITDFFTNISHEFKTPLSIILVDLQLMEYRLRDLEGPAREKLSKMVGVMRQNALRLLRLIGNLLDVTKIDAGFMKARLINADVVSLACSLVDTVKNYAENAGIEITFESKMESRMMPLDGEKMERVLLNLLSNAVKHTPEGGHIRVALEHAADKVTLCVSDDGEGIPEDRREFVFDRFRQVNTSLTRSSEGCGIGLSLTKALVELLGGSIWFSSELGRGSQFFVEFPVLRENERARSPEIDGMPRSRKVEMEFSDIHKAVKNS